MHGGRIYEYAEQSRLALENILDFSANINPLGPPKSVISAVHGAFEKMNHYPDSRQIGVKRVLTNRFQIEDIGMVFCGNGASEVLDLTIRNLCPEKVFVLEPAFSEYEMAARRSGAEVVHLSLTNVFADENFNSGDVIILNNPHNPTGQCWTRDKMLLLVKKLSTMGVYVLVDESFMDFRWDQDEISLLSFVSQFENVIIVRSATKIFSIPGLRFGFGVANPDLVRKIESNRDLWSVNCIAQEAAKAGYQDMQFLKQTWQWLKDEQDFVQRTWGSYPHIALFTPSVNYFLIKIQSEQRQKIVSSLEKLGIFLRQCNNFYSLGESYFRVAIKLRNENEYLWETILHLLDCYL